MKASGGLLALLAVPLAVIGAVVAAGIDRAPRHEIFGFASLVFGAATLAFTVAAASRKPDLTRGIDEEAITLYGVLVGASLVAGLGTLAFALAIGWPLVGLAVAAAGGAWFALWVPPRLRLMTAECSVVINRDVPAVFALLSDFRTMVRWDPRCLAVELVTPEPIGPGTRFRESGRLSNGNLVSGVDQIVDFEPNNRFSSTSLSGMKNLDVVTFEPFGGGTRVSRRFTVELQVWMALIGAALFKASLARETVANQEAAWSRAKQLLESGSEPTTP